MRISPDIVIALGLRVKVPGDRMVGRDVELMVTSCPADMRPPYQRLLSDAMEGNQELFAREDGVEASWRIVEPILGDEIPLEMYEPGSWGPADGEQAHRQGRAVDRPGARSARSGRRLLAGAQEFPPAREALNTPDGSGATGPLDGSRSAEVPSISGLSGALASLGGIWPKRLRLGRPGLSPPRWSSPLGTSDHLRSARLGPGSTLSAQNGVPTCSVLCVRSAEPPPTWTAVGSSWNSSPARCTLSRPCSSCPIR